MTMGSHDLGNLSSVKVIEVIDRIPDTEGMGVVVIDGLTVKRLRSSNRGGSDVVIELTTGPVGPTLASATDRHPDSSAPTERLSLGFNCGGAVLAWIGVVGTSSLAPVTGGLSAVGTAFLWGGALGATGQCVASTYRVANVYRGRENINRSLDNSIGYKWSMRGTDVVGLVGAGGALREIFKTGDIIAKEGLSFSRASTGAISRPMRQRLTAGFELQGAKRVPAATINQLVKQRMLDAFAGVVGLTGSVASGVIHEIIVWVTSPDPSKPPR